MSSTVNRQASIDSRRIALEREIAIRVPRFDSFVTEYSSNISTTGMFIISEKPQPPGTTFSFEFSVADDWKLIRGKAQVVWTRYRDEGPERPPGMGVKFLELDAQSRRLIRWIVEKHIREGGKPFELDELRSVIDQALEQVLDSEDPDYPGTHGAPGTRADSGPVRTVGAGRSGPSFGTARVRGSDRRVMPLVLTAASVLALVGILFWLTEWLPGKRAEEGTSARAAMPTVSSTAGGSEEVEMPASTTAEPERGQDLAPPTSGTSVAAGVPAQSPPDATRPAASSGPGRSQGAAGAAAPPIGSAYRSVSDAVSKWATAWSNQDVEAYLSCYSAAFSPPGGATRGQWASTRRERLRTPGYIKVSISGLEIDRIDDERASAVFNQSYRSDRFSDTVRKRLEFVWEDGTWKISSERSASV